jgi:methyl-accepting chemotaxis protein
VIQQNASAAEEMASTTDELTGQSDQLVSALGFFRIPDTEGAAAHAGAKPNGALGKLKAAVRHPEPQAAKKPSKSGVALKMAGPADHADKEFERY